MKLKALNLIAISLLVILTNNQKVKAEIVDVEEDDTIFERTFRNLHGEPATSPAVSRATVLTSWIEQKLDHFNDNDNRTWNMRYMSNDEFFEPGAPIFIYVGGEWAISSSMLKGGHMYDMAKEHNGNLFYTEHRYYGASRPTSDISNENIKYLHVKQALADLAHFIRTMKSSPSMANSKVILTGGSYSASVVTWFKKIYPELATGCWASSAPLYAKVNFVEYKEITGESIKRMGGPNCYSRIQNGITEMEELFANKQGAQVKAILKLCNTFDEENDLDVWTLFSEISDIFAGVVQNHNNGSIESVCKKIMSGEDDLGGLANYLAGVFGRYQCTDMSYKASLASLMDSAYTNNILRQWMYQTCNEFGWYQTSGSVKQPFGTQFPVTLYTTLCADAYGNQFTNEFINKQTQETNKFFGGLTPNVENVYMSHGQLDPWRAMGIQDEKQANVIPLYAHCKDFTSISSRDTPTMRASKLRIAELVREWVKA